MMILSTRVQISQDKGGLPGVRGTMMGVPSHQSEVHIANMSIMMLCTECGMKCPRSDADRRMNRFRRLSGWIVQRSDHPRRDCPRDDAMPGKAIGGPDREGEIRS